MDSSDYILLSELNDFIFCPRSIYWHHIYGRYDTSMYHTTDQIRGNLAHASIDTKKYSTRKDILQGIPIHSDVYQIQGKIDLYDRRTGILTERKRHIKKIYDGYYWQLYGQYFCLTEMGYVVTELRLYSMVNNKSYPVSIPNYHETQKFHSLIKSFRQYKLESVFHVNRNKCKRCIYAPLCDQNSI